jgi:glyoxylase-like metal-dependent hydrolase (beta-lactamase superfamily II)
VSTSTEQVTPYLRAVLAPNPGPMTLEGTNTWIVGDPAAGPVLVVDPGPLVESHLRAVLLTCKRGVAVVLLTHRHADHAASAAELGRRAGCAVRAADPAVRLGDEGLSEGDTLEVSGANLTAYATPGHTSDSCSFLLRGADGAARLLSGDTVLGRGTTVIAAPDGDLGAYLASLSKLERLVVDQSVTELLPGHGPRVGAPTAWLAFYRRHRQERLDQVRSALASGDRSVEEVVSRVYAGVDRSVRPAAEQSVRAQLDYLQDLEGPHERAGSRRC